MAPAPDQRALRVIVDQSARAVDALTSLIAAMRLNFELSVERLTTKPTAAVFALDDAASEALQDSRALVAHRAKSLQALLETEMTFSGQLIAYALQLEAAAAWGEDLYPVAASVLAGRAGCCS